ncbi:MAG TPA: hypothetical protein VEO74_15090 [Thermoanaerobaculia bacterium]|nr:hypothetical protein [Thermoanaerobaculia bacterium]
MLTTLLAAAVLVTKFGVDFSGEGAYHDHPELVTDTGASWVRLNLNLDPKDQDYTVFLGANVNVVLTLVNRDASNVDTTYGTPDQWLRAGFPYRSRSAYQQRIRNTLAAALPYVTAGRQVYVQCENEIGDVAQNPNSTYWRGTTDQYLAQLSALFEAVRSVSPAMRVVMSSFASGSLEIVLKPADPRYTAVTARLSRMLGEGQYDAADLHFYDCVEAITPKVAWVTARMPAGRTWISTENGGSDPNCPATPEPYSQNPSHFEEVEAQQVPLRLRTCIDAGGAVCLWFSLLDLKDESETFSHLGLLDQTSTSPRRKPAWDAFHSFVTAQAQAPRRRAARH